MCVGLQLGRSRGAIEPQEQPGLIRTEQVNAPSLSSHTYLHAHTLACKPTVF